MSLKIDRLQLEIIINNDQARKSLRLLDDEARSIQKSMKGMKEGTDEWINATKRLSSIKTQMDSILDSIGITGMSLKELASKQKEFNMLVNNLPANSPEYAKYKKTLDEINARMSELKGKAKDAGDALGNKLGSAFMKLGAMAAAAFSFDAIKDYVKGGIEAAIKLRDTEALLLEELNGQKAVQTDLIKLAKERAGSTMYSRLEIEEAEKFLAIQERTPEQIKKTIEAASNLAALTGGSLQDAVEQLDGTMEGRLSKGLGKLSKEFKELTKEQMYNGDAIDLVARKYSGLAEREMNTTEGRINLLSKAWKALQRTLGEAVMDSESFFSKGVSGATTFLNTIKKWFDIPMEKKLEEESSKVNLLATQLLDANIPAEKRNVLYRELESIAPSITAGLDAENLSYKDLAKNLEIYNNQLINKIILSRGDKKIEDANTVAANARQAVLNQELKIRKDLTDYLMYETKMAESQGGKLGAERKKWVDNVRSILADPSMQFEEKFTKIGKLERETGLQMLVYNKLLSEQGVAMQKVNGLLSDKEVLMQQLGLTENNLNGKQGEWNGPTIPASAVDYTKKTIEELNKIISDGAVQGASQKEKTEARAASKEIERREKSLQQLQKFTDDYNRIMQSAHDIEKMNFADKLSQTEQEIKTVNDKYDAEIKKLKEFMSARENLKMITPAKKQEMNSEIDNLEVEKKKQVNQVLEQAEKDFAMQITQIHENLRVARMTITNREVYEINKKYDNLQKEILDAIQYRYDEEIKMANGDLGKILVAEKNKADALSKIEDSMASLKLARKEETDKARKSGDEKFEEDLKSLKLKSETDLATGKEKIQMEVNQKYRKLLDENLNDKEKTKKIELQMEAETNARILQLAEETNRKKVETLMNFAKESSSTLAAVFNVQNEYENQSLQKDEQANNKKKENLKKQLDSKKISQKQYDAAIGKMDLEADAKHKEIAHKQAVRQKEIAIFNATIALLQAIIQAANIAPPADIVFPIIIAALMGVQLAALIATPVPAAADGRYDVIGQQDGKPYKKVPYQQSFTGIPGHPMLVNETGNEIVIDPYTTRNIQMNYPYIIEGINQARVPQRAGGYYPDSSTQRSAAASPGVVRFDQETLDVMRAVTEQFKKPVRASIVYDDMRDSMDTVTRIEKSVTRG